MTEVNKWWTHLSVTKKEEISQRNYPDCSFWWNELSTERKIELMNENGGRKAHVHHTRPKDMPSLT